MSENDSTDDLCEEHNIKVLIVDDYKPLRIMLRGRIEMQDGIMIIGEAADGVEAVSLAKNISPDVIIMDINMPNKDGITATKEIMNATDDIRIIALTFHKNESARKSMMKAGAVAFLSKSDDMNRLCDTIRKVASIV